MSPSLKAKQPRQKPDPNLVKQLELARILGVDERTIQRWHKDGLPRHGEGRGIRYPLTECIAWVRQRDREQVEAQTERGAPTDYDEAKARKMAAEAELAELELARARGTIVTVDDVERMLSAPLYRLRAKLLNLPSKWSPSLVGCRTIAEAQTRLEAAVEEAMLSLSEEGEEDFGEAGDES